MSRRSRNTSRPPLDSGGGVGPWRGGGVLNDKKSNPLVMVRTTSEQGGQFDDATMSMSMSQQQTPTIKTSSSNNSSSTIIGSSNENNLVVPRHDYSKILQDAPFLTPRQTKRRTSLLLLAAKQMMSPPLPQQQQASSKASSSSMTTTMMVVDDDEEEVSSSASSNNSSSYQVSPDSERALQPYQQTILVIKDGQPVYTKHRKPSPPPRQQAASSSSSSSSALPLVGVLPSSSSTSLLVSPPPIDMTTTTTSMEEEDDDGPTATTTTTTTTPATTTTTTTNNGGRVTWEERIRQLELYRTRYNTADVPVSKTSQYHDLSRWLANQRSKYKYGRLKEEKATQLRLMGCSNFGGRGSMKNLRIKNTITPSTATTTHVTPPPPTSSSLGGVLGLTSGTRTIITRRVSIITSGGGDDLCGNLQGKNKKDLGDLSGSGGVDDEEEQQDPDPTNIVATTSTTGSSNKRRRVLTDGNKKTPGRVSKAPKRLGWDEDDEVEEETPRRRSSSIIQVVSTEKSSSLDSGISEDEQDENESPPSSATNKTKNLKNGSDGKIVTGSKKPQPHSSVIKPNNRGHGGGRGKSKNQCKTWDQRKVELANYKAIHGHLTITTNRSKPYGELGLWLAAQRSLFRKNNLKKDRLDYLRSIGCPNFGGNTPQV